MAKKFKRKVLWITVITIISLFMVWLALYKNSDAMIPERVFAHPTIGPIRDVLIAKGILEYENNILIRSNVSGQVADISVEDGSVVKLGQILLRLEDPYAKINRKAKLLELKASKIKLDAIDKELHLKKPLVVAGGLPQFELDKKILERKLMLNDIERINLELIRFDKTEEMSLFKSPVPGLITAIFVTQNQRVHVGDQMMSLVGGEQKKIIAYVDALDIEHIWLGQSVLFSEHEDTGAAIEGKVESIDKDIAVSKRPNSVRVVIAPLSPIKHLLVSQQLYVEFIIKNEASVMRVLRELVYEKNGIKQVYLLTPQGVKPKFIETIRGDFTYDIVVSGLDIHDKLVPQYTE